MAKKIRKIRKSTPPIPDSKQVATKPPEMVNTNPPKMVTKKVPTIPPSLPTQQKPQSTSPDTFELLKTSGKPTQKVILQCTRKTGVQQLEVITKERVSFGRDNQKSDMELLIEPILPLERFPDNVKSSMRISSVHFMISLDDSGPLFMDAKSSNGTQHNGQALRPLQFVSVKEEDIFEIANVLQLKAQVLNDTKLSSLRLFRVNNTQNKEYLVLGNAVGIWPAAKQLLGPPHSAEHGWAPLQLLRRADGHIYLANVSVPELRLDTTKVAPGQAIPFNQGMGSIEFENCFWGWQGH